MDLAGCTEKFSRSRRRPFKGLAVCFALACIGLGVSAEAASAQTQPTKLEGIHKIRHVIIIMQENRSFDEYFGTFPGADGLPMKNGAFTVCNPDPRSGKCMSPYHDMNDANGGGPHQAAASLADIDNGKMDNFVIEAETGDKGCPNHADPVCTNSVEPDVMGYHDDREIPNYWAYARNFVLQDHMFEPVSSWSLPSHLYEVSAWSAFCTKHDDPMSCTNEADEPGLPPDFRGGFGPPGTKGGDRNGPPGTKPIYAWTDITYLLHKHGVSWNYFVFESSNSHCDEGVGPCPEEDFDDMTEGWWNPLVFFDTVKANGHSRTSSRLTSSTNKPAKAHYPLCRGYLLRCM